MSVPELRLGCSQVTRGRRKSSRVMKDVSFVFLTCSLGLFIFFFFLGGGENFLLGGNEISKLAMTAWVL